MKYLEMNVSVEPEIAGQADYQIQINKTGLNQDERFSKFLDFFRYSNQEFWANQKQILDFNVPIVSAKLAKKAKLTDFMTYTQNITFLNNIYSQKFIDIINAFNPAEYKSFEVQIENASSKYHFVFFQTVDFDEINFEQSDLTTGHKLRNNLEYFEAKSFDDYLKIREIHPLLSFDKISVPVKYSNLDIIKTRCSPLAFYSERLIDALLDFGVTGLEPKYNNSKKLIFY